MAQTVPVTIPTFSDPFYSYTISLDGTPYVFDFRYNQREDRWYLSVALVDGTELVGGLKIVCLKNLWSRAADVRLPKGVLMALSNSQDRSPPGIDELGEGKRVTLTYFPPA